MIPLNRMEGIKTSMEITVACDCPRAQDPISIPTPMLANRKAAAAAKYSGGD